MRGVQQETGGYFQSVLTEMKLPETLAAVAQIMPSLPEKDLGLLLTAASLKPSEIPNTSDDAKRDARERVQNLEVAQAVVKMANAYPTNPGLRNLAVGMNQTLQNAAMLGMDISSLDKSVQTVVDNGCALMLPQGAGIDVYDAMDALNEQRQAIEAKYLRGMPKAESPQKAREQTANVRALARDGLFISDGTGRGALLLDPWEGVPAMYPDGSPIRFDLNEAKKIRDKAALHGARQTALEIMGE